MNKNDIKMISESYKKVLVKEDGPQINLPPNQPGEQIGAGSIPTGEPNTSGEQKYDIDNRDISTTWLILNDSNYLEVDPWELVINAIENSGSRKAGKAIKVIQTLKNSLNNLR